MNTHRFAEGRGIKFLTPWMTTESNGRTAYPCPAPGQKWSEWLEHPTPAQPDGEDCGEGRYHLMKRLSAQYAPSNWWPWWVEYEQVIGESDEKVGVARLRLRRISDVVFHRIIRLGWCEGANLRGSNLRGSDLRGSDLSGSNLSGSNLRGSDLSGSNLSGSNLSGSNLSGSNLSGSDLSGSDLSGSNLRGSDLSGSDLSGSNLSGSNLSGAYYSEKTILPDGNHWSSEIAAYAPALA